MQESLEMWDFSATPAKGLLSSYFDLSDRYSPENLQYMVGAHYFFQAYYLNKISGSIFQERSIFSCKDVFLPELNVDSAAKERILRFLTALADRAPQPDFVIYLNTPPQLCWERIQSRNRPGECKSLSLEYLEALHKRHSHLLLKYFQKKIPVVILEPEEIDLHVALTIQRKKFYALLDIASGSDSKIYEQLGLGLCRPPPPWNYTPPKSPLGYPDL